MVMLYLNASEAKTGTRNSTDLKKKENQNFPVARLTALAAIFWLCKAVVLSFLPIFFGNFNIFIILTLSNSFDKKKYVWNKDKFCIELQRNWNILPS